MEISDIKLRVNHNVNFNLEDVKIKNLLIIGNTINFFGFFNDGRINMMSMNKNDRYHYMWLLKRCKEKTNIYIIGESEECEYYTNVFNYFGSLGIKVNWKFMETKEPKDYLEKLSSLKNMKFDYIVGNPPYNAGKSSGFKSGEYSIESDIVNRMNKICNKQIMVYPFSRWAKREKLSKENSTSGHLISIDLYDVTETFGVKPRWKYVGVYYYDNTIISNITKISCKNEIFKIESLNNLQNIQLFYSKLSNPYRQLENIIDYTKVLYDKLINNYKTMVNDHYGYIYEENRFKSAAKYGIDRKSKIQNKLERVKKYLKEGTYKYCLYKVSFNNSYNEVKEWLNTEDPDKVFNGQICWLCNDVNVRNNIKYWMESPLFDMWRRYYFGNAVAVADGVYGNMPALPFDMDENAFKTFVNNLYIFTEEDKTILREMNIHNIDNDEYYK